MPLLPTAPPMTSAGPPADPRAALASLLAGGGGPAPPADAAPPDADPFEALQQWLQDTHTLIAVLPDPQDTAIMTQCLAQGTKIQQRMMAAQQGAGDARQAVIRQLGNAGPAY